MPPLLVLHFPNGLSESLANPHRTEGGPGKTVPGGPSSMPVGMLTLLFSGQGEKNEASAVHSLAQGQTELQGLAASLPVPGRGPWQNPSRLRQAFKKQSLEPCTLCLGQDVALRGTRCLPGGAAASSRGRFQMLEAGIMTEPTQEVAHGSQKSRNSRGSDIPQRSKRGQRQGRSTVWAGPHLCALGG